MTLDLTDPRDDLATALKLAALAHWPTVKITRETAETALAALNRQTQCACCMQHQKAEIRTTEIL